MNGQTEKQTSEPLLKGMAKYSWSPCTYSFRSAAFYIIKIIYLFTKQAALMRRSMVLCVQIDRPKKKQTDREKGELTDKWMNGRKDSWRDSKNRHNEQTGAQTDVWTDRLIRKHTNGQMNRWKDRLHVQTAVWTVWPVGGGQMDGPEGRQIDLAADYIREHLLQRDFIDID
jgi:hypothetical protein